MKTAELEQDEVKRNVRVRYGKIAAGAGCGCGPSACCTETSPPPERAKTADAVSQKLGYSAADTQAVPAGANLGLGCGNPLAIASLKPGQTVLDLGSGAGFDAFLASKAVGEGGVVIGVDMTPEMISKARANQAKGGYANVEFRLGEIESLPVADATVDVIISNCVINLSPDKARVFREAFRVLKPGGRLAVSDPVALAPIPEHLRRDWELYANCIAGAALITELEAMLKQAGFDDIKITPKTGSRELIREWLPGKRLEDFVISATIAARKPALPR